MLGVDRRELFGLYISHTHLKSACINPLEDAAATADKEVNLFPGIVTRYVIRELAKIFAVSSLAFVLLMILVGLVEEATKKGLGPDIVYQLVPYIIPKALMFAMPATCLFSITCVFSRMSADNELVALQSNGLSKAVVMWPAVVLAIGLSLFAVWLNDISFAWSYWGIERVVLESSDKIAYGVLKSEGSFQADGFSIDVQSVDGKRLIEPRITLRPTSGEMSTISAREAIIESVPESHELLLTIRQGRADVTGDVAMEFDERLVHRIPLKSPDEVARALGNPSHLYLNQIDSEIEKQKDDIQRMEIENNATATAQLFGGDMFGLTHHEWTDKANELDKARERLRRLHVVPFRRWANGFSCLAFAIIGIPVAMRFKSASYATTFGICFLPILFLYYPLFIFGLDGAKYGALPPIAAWLGNAACFLIGAVLLVREIRR
ncbi:MAG: LptF/LptG family permease [Planctomycetota bacterium]